MFKFNYLASLDGYDVDGNKIKTFDKEIVKKVKEEVKVEAVKPETEAAIEEEKKYTILKIPK
jgi:hypothetical protein